PRRPPHGLDEAACRRGPRLARRGVVITEGERVPRAVDVRQCPVLRREPGAGGAHGLHRRTVDLRAVTGEQLQPPVAAPDPPVAVTSGSAMSHAPSLRVGVPDPGTTVRLMPPPPVSPGRGSSRRCSLPPCAVEHQYARSPFHGRAKHSRQCAPTPSRPRPPAAPLRPPKLRLCR